MYKNKLSLLTDNQQNWRVVELVVQVKHWLEHKTHTPEVEPRYWLLDMNHKYLPMDGWGYL